MNETPNPAQPLPPPPSPPASPDMSRTTWEMTIGFVLFVPIDFFILNIHDSDRFEISGVEFAALTLALAGLLYVAKKPWIGAGLVVGFILMTVVTGGVCTLFGTREGGAIGGLLYLLVALLFFIAAGIWRAVSLRVRRRN